MSTCKFIKAGDVWLTLLPEENKPLALTEEILFKMFGVTGLKETTVTVKDINGSSLDIIIHNGIKSVHLSDNGSHVFADVDTFTIPLLKPNKRLPNNHKEPDISIANTPAIVTAAWLDWKTKEYSNKGLSSLRSVQLAIKDAESLAIKDLVTGLPEYVPVFGNAYSTQPNDPQTILLYTVTITDRANNIIVEPVKSFPGSPNTLTIAWLKWKFKQLPPNEQTKESFKQVVDNAKEEIAKRLPDYTQDSIINSKLINWSKYSPFCGYFDVSVINLFIEWSD